MKRLVKILDKRPIGVFDSGLGGLTCVRKLADLLPGEDIIYLGDTARVPYGGKSKETIIKYTKQDIAFLLSHEVKAIVVACGTASTNAVDELAGDYTVPITGVVDTAAQRAVELTKSGRVGLIGTAATIRSGAYERRIKSYGGDIEVFSAACPLFVPLVENGRTQRGDIVIETVAQEYLLPLLENDIDTLILGCTHYPILYDIISDIAGSAVKLIDTGAETARFIANHLASAQQLNGSSTGGVHRYFVSDSAEDFTCLASLFLQTNIRGEVERVTLDSF